jgi:hypothetical protein
MKTSSELVRLLDDVWSLVAVSTTAKPQFGIPHLK